MSDDNNVSRMPSASDRDYFRVNGRLYLHCVPLELDKGSKQESKGFFIPTFVQDDDDFAGLSIDAFREQILLENPKEKDYFLKIQQLLSMMKRFFDAAMLGRKQMLYKKIMVNISGSGISFPSDVAYHPGQLLRISLFFPRFPYTSLAVIGEVVRSEKTEIGYEIKVKLADISESAREEILKFVNQCQRDNIRQD
ncbi:MAG: PilZ domain-containing protein [Deltaproteobacteria bacterium]|nr:PilZ domain-containing protein [Deltaproteobacteria bacterium]